MQASTALLAVLVSLSLSSPRQAGSPATQEVSAGPFVVLESKNGALDRRLLADFDIMDLAATGTALVRFEGVEPATRRAGQAVVHLEMARGGEVYGQVFGGDEEFLDLRLLGGTRLRLSVEEVASFRVAERIPSAWTEPIEAARQGDRLYRSSGAGLDRIDGTIEQFSQAGVTMDTSLGSKSFTWDEIAALFIEVIDEELRASELKEVVVDLLDGSRLPLLFRRLSSEGLDLETRAGRGVRIPLAALSEVFVAGSGVAFLSDLEPTSAAATSPFGDDLGMVWPIRRDRSTSGGPLRAGGQLWTRGLGVHAPSRVEYTLDGTWAELRGLVAIDDEVIPLPAKGSVIFRISTPEKKLWESPVVRGGDAPLRVPVLDMRGVTTLVLEVDMAGEMHVGDRADWLRFVLAR